MTVSLGSSRSRAGLRTLLVVSTFVMFGTAQLLWDSGTSGVTAQEQCPAPSPTPSSEPTPAPSPEPEPSPTFGLVSAETAEEPCDEGGGEEEPGGEEGNGKPGGGGDENVDLPGNSGPQRDAISGNDPGSGKRSHNKNRRKSSKRSKKNGKNEELPVPGGSGVFNDRHRVDGEFSTERLQIVAARLRAEGLSHEQILRRVYIPFIIGGPAAWTDTWGAPRYGPGPLVRTHEGQDVFCRYGDPVLAVERGRIEFDEGGLGGVVARLYRGDGSYFYYAHLSAWNTRDYETGDKVQPGDVIGYCGNTGNAITTPPHVHFGWYTPGGTARNPMGALVHWLETAESSAGVAYKDVTGRAFRFREAEVTWRLFGDTFSPDVSELRVSTESLLAAGSGGGALGLAEAALQAALADQPEVPTTARIGARLLGAGGGHSELAELLEPTDDPAPVTDAAD